MGLKLVGECFEDAKKGLSRKGLVEESEHGFNQRKSIQEFARILHRRNTEFFAIFGT